MSNRISPTHFRPTRKDVAALANVSGTTVSRVMSGRDEESISPGARDRVLQAARELGYSPNSAAKALRSGRSGLVSLWMCLEYSLYRGRVLAEMRSQIAKTDYALAVTDIEEVYSLHHSVERALRVPSEGVIAFDASTAAHVFVRNSERLAPNLPFVSMGAFWSDAKSYVGVDLKWGAEEAVRHLLATGRRRIAHVVPRGTWFAGNGDRHDGYRDAIEAAGFAPQIIDISDAPDERIASITERLSQCRESGTMPDALVCFYDDMAVDAVYALRELGLQPGADVALVGFNGTIGIERGLCPITTVSQPVEEMCRLAIEFLDAQIENPGEPIRQVMLKPELIVRESSGG